MPIPSSDSRFFYQFLGAHSLLIGLLPFFLPVYLWQLGLNLASLSILIGVSGLAFTVTLRLWQVLARRCLIRHLITLSFGLEMLLIITVGLMTMVPGAPLFEGRDTVSSGSALIVAALIIGLANGLYNAFFWTTQRTLFLSLLGSNDSGRQYGNFQIFVTVFLKVGIVTGGWLLEAGGLVPLLALSAGVGFAANSYLSSVSPTSRLPELNRITLLQSLRFRDRQGSREVFRIDGLFLYLESHFWTLSLFLLVQKDFSMLGFTVVGLALMFALLFYLIKNRIDHLPAMRVYKAAVWFYALSWLLRFTLDSESSQTVLLTSLLVITFFSSFFRLAFNKHFFDVAKRSGSLDYLLLKSYSSQAWLAGGLIFLGGLLWFSPEMQEQSLKLIYLPAAMLSLIYLRYRSGG